MFTQHVSERATTAETDGAKALVFSVMKLTRHAVLADVELAMSSAEAELAEELLRARRRAEDRTPPVS